MEFLSHGLSGKWIPNKFFPMRKCCSFISRDVTDESAFILLFGEQDSGVASYDAYTMLFPLKVFVWINLISSLFVVVSWFAMFDFVIRVQLRVDRKILRWESPCICIAVYIDGVLHGALIHCAALIQGKCQIYIWLRQIICASHKAITRSSDEQ